MGLIGCIRVLCRAVSWSSGKVENQFRCDPNDPSLPFVTTVPQQSGRMLARKRPRAPPVSGESVQNKLSKAVEGTANSASISPSIENSSAIDIPARAALHSERFQRVTVFTQLSENIFFRGLPWLSPESLRFITVDSAPPAHPILPKSVPCHLKQVYSKCTRAAKIAWICESRLAEFPDEDVSDEHLDKLYKVACRKLARHQRNPQASATTNSLILHR